MSNNVPKPGDRCQVWTVNSERQRVMEYEAVFLGWGQDCEDFETGPGNFTAAIVKHGTSVRLIYAPSVEFPDD